MKTIELAELLEYLCSRKAHHFEDSSIDEYLSSTHLAEDSLLPFVHFREDTYGRNLVYRSENFELIVLTWLPGQRTPIHDHAAQRCWMWVDTGELTFKNYALSGNALKPLGKIEVHAAGGKTYIDDELGLHAITNAGKLPAVSLHLYAAPINECRIYNESLRDFETIELEYLTEADWSPDWSEVHSRLAKGLHS